MPSYSDGRDISFESFYEESAPASPGIDEQDRLFNDEVIATQVAMSVVYRWLHDPPGGLLWYVPCSLSNHNAALNSALYPALNPSL